MLLAKNRTEKNNIIQALVAKTKASPVGTQKIARSIILMAQLPGPSQCRQVNFDANRIKSLEGKVD
jgi:hypothetical protein